MFQCCFKNLSKGIEFKFLMSAFLYHHQPSCYHFSRGCRYLKCSMIIFLFYNLALMLPIHAIGYYFPLWSYVFFLWKEYPITVQWSHYDIGETALSKSSWNHLYPNPNPIPYPYPNSTSKCLHTSFSFSGQWVFFKTNQQILNNSFLSPLERGCGPSF